jgi:hypothetical protein
VVDVSDRVFALMGKSIHYIMEKNAEAGAIVEERLRAEINGWKITGKPDWFTEGVLQDWKFLSVWVKILEPNNRDFINQMNSYNFLAAKSGFGKIEKLENVFIYRDWLFSRVDKKKDYPKRQIEVIRQPILPLAEAEQYIIGRTLLFQNTESYTDKQLPLCSEEERWHQPTTYALKKKGRESAIKVCETEDQATTLLTQGYKKAEYVDIRRGKSKKCGTKKKGYCDCREFCEYYQSIKEQETEEEE